MLNRRFVLILLGIGVVLALVPGERNRSVRGRPSTSGVVSNQKTPRQSRPPLLLGKIGPPAGLSIDLARPDDRNARAAIVVRAQSQVPVGSGLLTLQVPQIAAEPAATHVLWSGSPSRLVDHTADFILDSLPSGRYRFVAVFEFTTDYPNAHKIAISKSLYLDAGPRRTLSSNVSFRHIERLQLKTELQEWALKTLKPGLAKANPDVLAREFALMEAANPGVIAAKVAELRAADPDVARRIMELNRVEPQEDAERVTGLTR